MIYNDLIGIPFSAEGDVGINCYNLLRRAFKKHGIKVPETNISVCACREASNKEIANNVSKYWLKIKKPKTPCAVVIRSTNPDFANHIGTYVGSGRILHVAQNINSVIERMYPKYENKILGFYEFVGE
jgi:cell wall-associated NlpC family hydrolase